MIALVADPSRDIRAAVPEVAVVHGGYDARSAAEKATFQRLTASARAALTRQFAVETDPTALAAIATALELYPNSASLPARAGAPTLAGATALYRDELSVTVTCLHAKTILMDARLMVTRDGQPAAMIPSTIYTRCDDRAGDFRAGKRLRLAPGRYAIAADIDVDGKRTALDLGAVVADASGELTIVRPSPPRLRLRVGLAVQDHVEHLRRQQLLHREDRVRIPADDIAGAAGARWLMDDRVGHVLRIRRRLPGRFGHQGWRPPAPCGRRSRHGRRRTAAPSARGSETHPARRG